jgi:molybdopterin-guanine dinucleotide biosynthesis protein A
VSAALVVLAGGRGRRLGGAIKPLLVRPDGRTLLAHLCDVLSPLADETLIVAPRAIAHLFAGRVVEDPGQGPGLALAAAARATASDLILLTAGDQPSPSATLAELLLAKANDGGTVVTIDGILQPTFAAYSAAAVRAIDPPETSLRGTCAAIDPFVIDARELDPAMLAAFDDVDTPADLERYRLSLEGVPTWSHLAGEEP